MDQGLARLSLATKGSCSHSRRGGVDQGLARLSLATKGSCSHSRRGGVDRGLAKLSLAVPRAAAAHHPIVRNDVLMTLNHFIDL